MSGYLNFDLLIEKGHTPNQYTARVLNSPAGQAKHTFTYTPNVNPFQEMFTLQTVQNYGRGLFALLGEPISGLLSRSRDEARRQGKGVRLRLRLEDAPALARLPWETLHDPTTERTFALSVDTPIVRYPELPEAAAPLQVDLPLKILVMIASPNDLPPLDTGKEWKNLNDTLAELKQRGLVTIERLDTPTLNGLLKQLRRGDYHIFHFIGHGEAPGPDRDGELVLEDATGASHPVSGTRLGTFLRDEHSLRLAILNACEGARAEGNPFSSVALRLVQQGTPAVIAMQTQISDHAAIAFEHEFYSALADGLPVEAALGEARKAIFAENEVEWAIPVLHMRSESGQLFEVKGTGKRQGGSATVSTPPPVKSMTPAPVRPDIPAVRDLSANASEINDLRNYLQRDRLVLFIGPDLPQELTGAPDRMGLATLLAQEKGLPAGQSLATVAQQVMGGANRFEFTQFLKRQLSGVQPGPFYHALAGFVQRSLSKGMVITTAYHRLFEAALESAGTYNLQVVSQDSMIPFLEPDAPVLFKLYGGIQQADLIVTEQDQNALIRGRAQNRQDMVDEVARLFKRNSVLFLGVDLHDPVILALFDDVAGGKFQVPSFAVRTGLSEAERASLESNRGVKVLDMEVLEMLGWLEEQGV